MLLLRLSMPLNNRYLSFLCVFALFDITSLFSSIPLSRCTHSVFIPLNPKGILVASKFWQLLEICYEHLHGGFLLDLPLHSFGKAPKTVTGESYAGRILFRCLSLVSSVIKETAKLSSKQLLHFILPPVTDHSPSCSPSFLGWEMVSVDELYHSKKAGVISCVSLYFSENIWYRTCFHVLIFFSDCMGLGNFLVCICVFLCSDVQPF